MFAQNTTTKVVGGDFFDVILLPDNRLGFIVGDVSGKVCLLHLQWFDC
jgi:serine phosphatase RsbU (regulator of sigma subunit)